MAAFTMSNRWKSTIRVASGFALLAFLLGMVDFRELLASVRDASPVLLVASFALFALQGVPESLRLRTVYAAWGISFKKAWQLFIIGMFFSNFMPGVIGADVYQVQQMNAIKPGLTKPISLSLLLRTSGLMVNLAFALIVIFLEAGNATEFLSLSQISNWLPSHSWFWVVLVGIALFFVAAFLWIAARVGRFAEIFAETSKDFYSAITSLTGLQTANLYIHGVFVVLLRAGSLYVLLLACGTQASLPDVILAVTVTVLALLVPISFAGIGVREISLSAILVASGVAAHDAVAISLLGRFFIWMLSLIGGVWFVSLRNKNLTR
jgi:uncharacterized protein (TIRG00374 family)